MLSSVAASMIAPNLLRRTTRGAVGISIVIIAWEAMVRLFGISDFLLPAPSSIAQRIIGDWGLLAQHLSITMLETILGFAAAVLVGVVVAIIVTTSERTKDVVMPIVIATQLIPKVAVAPLVLLWFGYGISSKVVVAFLIAFFPIVIDMATGLTMVEKELIDLLRSLGAKRWKVFVKAQIPHSLPFLFSGMRIAVTLAVIGAIVGEFIGGSQGIGYLIVISTSELKTDLVFACLMVLTAAGFVLFALIGFLERLVVPWSAAEREELMVITGM